MKANSTLNPILVEPFLILTEKQPSLYPELNPAIHSGWGITWLTIKGLSAGIISGKAYISNLDKPKFKEALIYTILWIPERVLLNPSQFIIATADLNSSKSAFFCIKRMIIKMC